MSDIRVHVTITTLYISCFSPRAADPVYREGGNHGRAGEGMRTRAYLFIHDTINFSFNPGPFLGLVPPPCYARRRMTSGPVEVVLSPSIRLYLSPGYGWSLVALSPRWMNCNYSGQGWHGASLYRAKVERRVCVSCCWTPWVARSWGWTGSSGTISRSGWGTW